MAAFFENRGVLWREAALKRGFGGCGAERCADLVEIVGEKWVISRMTAWSRKYHEGKKIGIERLNICHRDLKYIRDMMANLDVMAKEGGILAALVNRILHLYNFGSAIFCLLKSTVTWYVLFSNNSNSSCILAEK